MLTVRVSRQGEFLFEREYDRSQLVVGRGKDADVVLEHGTVSRRHALLYIQQGVIAVTDLGSSNGTYVNGYKLEGPASLREDDVVYCGIFSIEMLPPMRESSRPAPYPQPPPDHPSQPSYDSQPSNSSQPSYQSQPSYRSRQHRRSRTDYGSSSEHGTYDGPPPRESSRPQPAPVAREAPAAKDESNDIGKTLAPGELDLERLGAEMEKRERERKSPDDVETPEAPPLERPSPSASSAPSPRRSSPPPPSWASQVGRPGAPIPAPSFDGMEEPSAFQGPGGDD